MLKDAQQTQYRELRFAAKPDTETRSFTIPVSSEVSVERWWGTEVLDHSAESIDLTRLQDGAPLLLDHDPSKQIGVIEGASLGEDRRLNATVRFSRSALGEEVFQDVIDGIRRNVSIGYRIDDIAEVSRDTYNVTRWTPIEISCVSCPADSSVGFGRSESNGYNPLDLLTKRNSAMSDPIENEIPAGDEQMPETNAPEVTETVNVAEIAQRAISNERKRISGIRESVRMAKLPESVAETLIDSDKPLDECRSEVIRLWSEKVDQNSTVSGRPEGEPEPAQSRAMEIAQTLLKQVAGA